MLTDHLVDHLLNGASFAGVPPVVSCGSNIEKEKRFAMENFPEFVLFGSLVQVVAMAVAMAATMMIVTVTTLLDDNNLVGSIM